MKYTRIIKVFVFFGLIFSLISCGGSLTKSVIYRLEDEGYDVEPIEFDAVDSIDSEFEVVGAKNVYEIYNKRDTVTAYLYEFENATQIEEMFEDLDLDIANYEELVYENILVVPYEYSVIITRIMYIIKR
jgi:hypothetical protein